VKVKLGPLWSSPSPNDMTQFTSQDYLLEDHNLAVQEESWVKVKLGPVRSSPSPNQMAEFTSQDSLVEDHNLAIQEAG